MAVSFPYGMPRAFMFNVTVGDFAGEGECSFQDVSGLNVTLGTEEVKEGGVNNFTYKLPGRAKYDNLVLKRGLITGSPIITWVNDAVSNFVFRPKLVKVQLIDPEQTPIITWSLYNAYPVSIKMSELKAMDNALAIETLELAYNFFRRTN
ncbi:phage tail-like protein [Filimonas zeae]|uniref:Phage tail protein n=1 Tax=Filimonas zeae TaxID=1737353 RepID=A0A917IZY4_9BACT|nr:phage tail protein [Filimonas zeae]MDR6339682.1 phage tail-like protein [Filimonas zeae]GGH69125.1 phage tail protein [Filimonas zeae]